MDDSITGTFKQLDRELKLSLRSVDSETQSREERRDISQLKLALNEIRLDIRDYEYAQTRSEQLKWGKLGRHNLRALRMLVLHLDTVFSPIDVASIDARVDKLSELLT